MSFDKLIVSDHAKTAQIEVIKHLEGLGFVCRMEHKVSSRGAGGPRSGRVDILATKNSKTLGIEVDRINPRKKSIHKLTNNDFDFKIILCRGGSKSYKINDIYIFPLKIN